MTQTAEYSGQEATLLDSTIGAHFDAVVQRDPDHLAIVMPHQQIRWSYGEFNGANRGDRANNSSAVGEKCHTHILGAVA